MNFDGPVRVADTAGSGTAAITLSFEAWKGASIAPSTHAVTVLPPKVGPKAEAVAVNLIASLVHPERKASISEVRFSPDGSRLFVSGYPSGVVQIWDVASRKELRRIETPPGSRGSADYALITPDWKTLYVPVEKSTVKSFERDGKKLSRVENSGTIRVWDLTDGKEQEPLKPTEGTAPVFAKLAPDGRFLVCVERPSYDSTDTQSKDVTVVWDLETRKKWKLADRYAIPSFAPDGKSVVVCHHDFEAKTSVIRRLELASEKELARVPCPEKERWFSGGPVSPDGAVVALSLGGKKGAPLEVWLLDANTLEQRGKVIGKGDSERYGWSGGGLFTPDSKLYVVGEGVGNLLVWDVAGSKLERTLATGSDQQAWFPAIRPDGKTLAIGWSPKWDLEGVREPDPRDLPQPRISLVDLTGKNPPRVLIAPHGYSGHCAFSPDGKTLALGSSGAVHLFDLTK